MDWLKNRKINLLYKSLIIAYVLGLLLSFKVGSSSTKLKVESCTYNDISLYGKVQFVNSFPDLKIQYVDNFPDLKVKMVNNFPDRCGEWQVVESLPDF